MILGAWLRASVIGGSIAGLVIFVVVGLLHNAPYPPILAVVGGSCGGAVAGLIYAAFMHRSLFIAVWWMFGWAVVGLLGWYVIALLLVGLQTVISPVFGVVVSAMLSWMIIGLLAGILSGWVLSVVEHSWSSNK